MLNTSAKKPVDDNIYSIDLQTLATWRRVSLKIDNRPAMFDHFSVVTTGNEQKPVLMFGAV